MVRRRTTALGRAVDPRAGGHGCVCVFQVLKGHDEHVITCLQVSGDLVVSGSDDNTLKVWSAVTGKVCVCVCVLQLHICGEA